MDFGVDAFGLSKQEDEEVKAMVLWWWLIAAFLLGVLVVPIAAIFLEKDGPPGFEDYDDRMHE